MAPENNIAVEVKNVTKSYGETRALDNISFTVKKNELYGLIGPDGAGKTSMFRILTTLLLPDKGKAGLMGLDTTKDYKKLRHMIGYMPGKFSLYQDLSVEENLQFFATVFGTTIEENYHLVEDIYAQIEPFKTRLAGNLSGGMKQKLALSCALIHKPEVLILDEPTTGVDAVSRMEFWDMLIRLKKAGITILVSTPYMDEAAKCDRVSLIQKGSIMQTDTPANIIESYRKRLFSISAKDKAGVVKNMREFEKTHSAFLFGQDIHYTATNDELEPDEIIHFLKQNGFEDAGVKEIEPDIEDCFMELMNETMNPEL